MKQLRNRKELRADRERRSATNGCAICQEVVVDFGVWKVYNGDTISKEGRLWSCMKRSISCARPEK